MWIFLVDHTKTYLHKRLHQNIGQARYLRATHEPSTTIITRKWVQTRRSQHVCEATWTGWACEILPWRLLKDYVWSSVSTPRSEAGRPSVRESSIITLYPQDGCYDRPSQRMDVCEENGFSPPPVDIVFRWIPKWYTYPRVVVKEDLSMSANNIILI